MERKLTLRDICGYIPNRLAIRNESSYDIVIGIENDKVISWFMDTKQFENYANIEDVKPILRPLPDLYRTIAHNRKEIVPIVELAKIHNQSVEWVCDYPKGEEYLRIAYKKNNPHVWFDYSDFGFRCGYGSYGIDDVFNQYQLFDYLHELKVDFRNLIESGLAVSVYDLENNPYK